jgi:hypothetical protein
MYYTNRMIVVACAALIVAAFAVAFVDVAEANPPGSCGLQGTWIGEAGAGRFLSSYHSTTPLSGTIDLEMFGSPADVGGVFPGATDLLQVKGVWQRVRPRNYAYTMVTYGIDANRQIVYSIKNKGTKKLSQDCNSGEIYSCSEYFDPNGNLVGGPFCGTSAATRLQVEQ